jgi:hypothetical protein
MTRQSFSESEKKLRLDLEPGAKLPGMFNRDRALPRQDPSGNRMIDPKDFPEGPGRDQKSKVSIPKYRPYIALLLCTNLL